MLLSKVVINLWNILECVIRFGVNDEDKERFVEKNQVSKNAHCINTDGLKKRRLKTFENCMLYCLICKKLRFCFRNMSKYFPL